MLSILIPIYNVDVRPLVEELHQQSISCDIPFEIILIDDASEDEFKLINNSIEESPKIYYTELDKNIGRSAIRNLLITQAEFDNLLFLDSDSLISKNPRFIKNYVEQIDHYSVVSGGRLYPDQDTTSEATLLHYKYGIQRESVSISKRLAYPVRYFHSNNFMVKKDLALSYPFPKMMNGYGYEDIMFASTLHEARVTISHIENPVEHHGLIDTTRFLNNIKSSNSNLLDFYAEGTLIESPLLKTFERLRTTKTINLVRFVLNILQPTLEKNLNSQNPSLLFLDLYKLGNLLNQYKENNR